jgi:hypothetical protein
LSSAKKLEAPITVALDSHAASSMKRSFLFPFFMYDGAFQETIKRLSCESWEALEMPAVCVLRALLQAQPYGLAGQRQSEK